MSNTESPVREQDHIKTFPIASDEQARELALRERFAQFWASASGSPRQVYDTFISASPMTSGVTTTAVIEERVRGWWVRPGQVGAGIGTGTGTGSGVGTGNDSATGTVATAAGSGIGTRAGGSGSAEVDTVDGNAILYIHGGGYVLGSAQAYLGFVSQIVSRTRIPAFVLDYPLAPEASLPAAPSAAMAAWLWLAQQGCKRVAIVGDSAGAGLSLVTLAQLAKMPGAAQPVAGAVFSPWTDLAFTGASMTDPAVQDPLISHEYLQDCARKYLGLSQATDPLASPLAGDLRGLPPLLIQVGTDERLLDDSRQYAARAAQAGVRVQLEIWEGMHHVFQMDVAHIQSARSALDRAAAFLIDAFRQH